MNEKHQTILENFNGNILAMQEYYYVNVGDMFNKLLEHDFEILYHISNTKAGNREYIIKEYYGCNFGERDKEIRDVVYAFSNGRPEIPVILDLYAKSYMIMSNEKGESKTLFYLNNIFYEHAYDYDKLYQHHEDMFDLTNKIFKSDEEVRRKIFIIENFKELYMNEKYEPLCDHYILSTLIYEQEVFRFLITYQLKSELYPDNALELISSIWSVAIGYYSAISSEPKAINAGFVEF